jgi:hypothetical protein
VFLIAGIANPQPRPDHMLILGGACVALVEVAEFIIWRHDRRRARLHPDPTPAWPTTNCPRSTWTTRAAATATSTSACAGDPGEGLTWNP